MTTLTNSEGIVLTCTTEVSETLLLQLNSSNNYYTSGGNILFTKIGSNRLLLLDHAYHINRIIFQNQTIDENTINGYNL